MEAKIFLVFFGAVFSVAFSIPLQNSFDVSDDRVPQCYQHMQNGLCLAYIPSWYYVPSTNTCETFIYGGCGGNSNRFFTREQCMATCGGSKPEEIEFKLDLDDVDPCDMPSKTGPCRANLPRFYFNGDKCENFMYGGCQGNENNFKSVEECQQRCGPKSSEETTEVQPESEAKSEEVSEEVLEELPRTASEEEPHQPSTEVPTTE